MAGMLPEDDLYAYWRMRDKLPRDDPRHAVYGPMEHRQFTREAVERNPLMAVPLGMFTPIYTAGKALDKVARDRGIPRPEWWKNVVGNSRSPASMDEIWAGYHGITEGMLNRLVPSAQAHHEQSETVQRPDGKWVNVYGRGLPQAGQPLPGTGVYETVEEAVRAARTRSDATPSLRRVDGGMLPKPAPRTRHGGGGVRG